MKLGALIWAVGMAFLLAETIYFGSNWLPQSAAESVCDFIGALICTAGLILALTRRSKL